MPTSSGARKGLTPRAVEDGDRLALRRRVGQGGAGLLRTQVVEGREHRPQAGQLGGDSRGVHRLGVKRDNPAGPLLRPFERFDVGVVVREAHGHVHAQPAQSFSSDIHGPPAPDPMSRMRRAPVLRIASARSGATGLK